MRWTTLSCIFTSVRVQFSICAALEVGRNGMLRGCATGSKSALPQTNMLTATSHGNLRMHMKKHWLLTEFWKPRDQMTSKAIPSCQTLSPWQTWASALFKWRLRKHNRSSLHSLHTGFKDSIFFFTRNIFTVSTLQTSLTKKGKCKVIKKESVVAWKHIFT